MAPTGHRESLRHSVRSGRPLATPVAPAQPSAKEIAKEPGRGLEPGELVAGVVLDAYGGAVPGAVVLASADGGVLARSISDEGGFFRASVAPGWLEVSATAEGYSLARERIHAPLAGMRLVLAPAASLEGRVVMQGSEAAVANVTVTASRLDGVNEAGSSAVTTDDGTFRFSALSGGQYALAVIDAHFRAGPTQVSVGVGRSEQELVLEAVPAVRLDGVLAVTEGLCSDAYVHVTGPVETVQAFDAERRVRIEGLVSGRYDVHVDCPSLGVRLSEAVDVSHAPLGRTWPIDEGIGVTVHARRIDGSPADDITVQIYPAGRLDGDPSASCVGGRDGSFVCRGLAEGEHVCRAQRGAEAASEPVAFSTRTGASAAIELRVFAAGSIRAFFAPSDGRLPGYGQVAPVARRAGHPPSYGRPEADHYVFEGLALGDYTVFVGDELPDTPSSRRVRLERDGQVEDVWLAVDRSLRIAGRVLDEHGLGVPDAWVEVASTEPEWLVATARVPPVLTNEDGEFSLEELLPGRYGVQASSELGRALASAVAPGGTPIVLRLLPSEAAISEATAAGDEPASRN